MGQRFESLIENPKKTLGAGCKYPTWLLSILSGGASAHVVLVVKKKKKKPAYKRCGFDPWVGKLPWRRAWQPTPLFLPGEFHEQRSLVGYSP